MDGRRCKILRVSPQFLARLLTDGIHAYRVIEGGLPDDARVVDAKMEFATRTLSLLVESESFEPVPDGSHYPPMISDHPFSQLIPPPGDAPRHRRNRLGVEPSRVSVSRGRPRWRQPPRCTNSCHPDTERNADE